MSDNPDVDTVSIARNRRAARPSPRFLQARCGRRRRDARGVLPRWRRRRNGRGTAPPSAEVEVDPLTRFDHLVVVMFENRSFDNLLGYLYAQGPTPADWPKSCRCRRWFRADSRSTACSARRTSTTTGSTAILAHPHDFDPAHVPQKRSDWTHPNPIPAKVYDHTQAQLARTARCPASSPTTRKKHRRDHGRGRRDHGFVRACAVCRCSPDSRSSSRCSTTGTAAVPSETYCNRSFFHASTSSGYVENAPEDAVGRTTRRRRSSTGWRRQPTSNWKVVLREADDGDRSCRLPVRPHRPRPSGGQPQVSRQRSSTTRSSTATSRQGTLPRVRVRRAGVRRPARISIRRGRAQRRGGAARQSTRRSAPAASGPPRLHAGHDAARRLRRARRHVRPRGAGTGVPAPSNPSSAGRTRLRLHDRSACGCPRSRFPRTRRPARSSTRRCITPRSIRTLRRKYGLPAAHRARPRSQRRRPVRRAGATVPRAAASWPAFPNPVSSPAG